MTQQSGAGGGWPQNPGQPGTPGQAPPQAIYGVASQPYGVPAQPAPAGAPPQGLGFVLNPDERVLWAVKRSYTAEKLSYWLVGVMLALVLIGLWFIYMAVTMEARNPRALVLTNRRLVVIEGSGAVSSYWLNQTIDLTPMRGQAGTGGRGGLVGALVAAAVTAGLNAYANRNEKVTPAYWARTIAIVLKQQDGRDIPVSVKPHEATVLGPMLARCLLMGEADTLPAYDASSIQVGGAVVAASTPGTWMGGGVLMLFSTLLGYTGVNRVAWGAWAFGLAFAVVGLGMLVGAFALFYAASKASWKLAESQGKKPNKLMPIAIPAGIAVVLTLLIVGSGISAAIRAHRYRSKVSNDSYTAPTAIVTTPPATTLSTAGGPLSPGAIENALVGQGYRFRSGGSVDKSIWANATTYSWSMSHSSTHASLWARLTELPPPTPLEPKSCSAASTHAASVELSGAGAAFGAAMQLNSLLAAKAPTGGKALAAALAGNGWKLSSPMMADVNYTFGHRPYLAIAKKGGVSATIHVLDYSPAASGKDDAAVQVSGTRVLIVSAGTAGASQDLLRKIAR
jgi:amino acid transporter